MIDTYIFDGRHAPKHIRVKVRIEAREELEWLASDRLWRGLVLIYGPAPWDMIFPVTQAERVPWGVFLARERNRLQRAGRRASIKLEDGDASLYVSDPRSDACGGRANRLHELARIARAPIPR